MLFFTVALLVYEGAADAASNCPAGQSWVDCLELYCEPQTCDDLGFPVPCYDNPDRCDGGCVCDNYYVKDSNGKCIPRNKCLTCGGDHHATGGCGLHCGNLCSNYKNNGSIGCPAICYPNSCDCQKGYVFNDIIDLCVKPEECPIPCNGDPYAVPTSCNNLCRGTCAFPRPLPCNNCYETGCQCARGYVLDKPYGKCIPTSHCPEYLGCNGDPNAIITECGSYCPRTCEPYNPPIFCPAVCVENACTCKEGYILSRVTKNCIPIYQCVNGKYSPGGWIS